MIYKIKASLLEPSWFEKAIFKTLDMWEGYADLKDIMKSPLAEFQRNYLSWGGRHKSLIDTTGDYEKALNKRMSEFIVLYSNIKKDGYKDNEHPPMLVYFDEDGFIRLYDGHHRLSIIRYLKKNYSHIGTEEQLDSMISVDTNWDSTGIDPHKLKGADFPLVEVATSIFGREEMYQRIPDERLKHFTVQRPDAQERLAYFEKNLVSGTVLDIGCSEGFFCHELAKRDYGVTGIENGYKGDEERGRKLLSIARYEAIIQNVKMNCILGDWKDLIRNPEVKFDNILYLSILHNEINALGSDQAFKNLRLFRGKCQRLFVEVPDVNVQKDWKFHFELEKLCIGLERETGMKVIDVFKGYRPIILLESQLDVKGE